MNDQDRPWARFDHFTTEELEQEINRRGLVATLIPKDGYYIKYSIEQVGCHAPGPRSPGEAPDWYETEHVAMIYNLSGKRIKHLWSDTVAGLDRIVETYIHDHLSPAAKLIKEDCKTKLPKLQKKLAKLQEQKEDTDKQYEKLTGEINKLTQYLKGGKL